MRMKMEYAFMLVPTSDACSCDVQVARKKSKSEVMAEVIAKSKQHKVRYVV